MDFKDSSVKSATGKTIDEWFDLIAKSGRQDAQHKEIAEFLFEKYNLSYWWAQEITVLYEKGSGRRVTGQTQDGSFQIGVSRTSHLSKEEIWNFLVSKAGAGLIFGGEWDRERMENSHGTSSNGISYELNTWKPLSHIRMKWKLPDWSSYSILQIRVTSNRKGKTTLSFHQEKLSDTAAREKMRRHWREKAKEMLRELEKPRP